MVYDARPTNSALLTTEHPLRSSRRSLSVLHPLANWGVTLLGTARLDLDRYLLTEPDYLRYPWPGRPGGRPSSGALDPRLCPILDPIGGSTVCPHPTATADRPCHGGRRGAGLGVHHSLRRAGGALAAPLATGRRVALEVSQVRPGIAGPKRFPDLTNLALWIKYDPGQICDPVIVR